jgi:hypothetical protein
MHITAADLVVGDRIATEHVTAGTVEHILSERVRGYLVIRVRISDATGDRWLTFDGRDRVTVNN